MGPSWDTLAVVRPNAPVEEWCRRGEACYEGVGVRCNSAEAVKWFRWAALRGFARAQCWLGYAYHHYLSGVERDVTESARWFRKAAEQGDVIAECSLGVCFEGGLGVSKNADEMVMWYRRAAGQGHLGAQFRLGVHYTTAADRGPVGSGTVGREGLEWLERAAEKGHAESGLRLGHLRSASEGGAAEAVKWYRMAVQAGSSEAKAALGRCFEEGRGITQDYAEAMGLYREAAEDRGEYGPYYLGSCYARGRGVVDPVEASKWIRRAAEQGCEEAMVEIAGRYERGEGVPQNSHEARRWLGEAGERHAFEERCLVIQAGEAGARGEAGGGGCSRAGREGGREATLRALASDRVAR